MRVDQIDLLDESLYLEGRLHDALTRLREESPVRFNPEEDGPGFWAVTRYDDVLTVSKDAETYCSSQGVEIPQSTFAEYLHDTVLIMTDPPKHTKLRTLVSRAFTPRRIRELEEFMRGLTAQTLDRVVPGEPLDFLFEVAAPLPMVVIMELMGVPPDEREQLGELMNRSLGYTEEEIEDAEDLMPLVFELWTYLGELRERVRAQPGDDMISALLRAEVDGHRLSDFEVDTFLHLLVGAGIETTRTAVTGGMLAFMEHPGQWQRLLDDRSLLPTALEEILRWVTPVTAFRRTATRDTVIRGQAVAAGDKVVVFYASANRDDEIFPDPFTFDVSRTPNEHLAFGHGTHFCLGSSLARLEMKVMYEALLERFPKGAELAGEIERKRNPHLYGVAKLPVSFR